MAPPSLFHKKRGRVAAAASWVLTGRASTSLSLTAVAGVLVVAAQGIVLVAVAVSSLMANTMQASTAALGCLARLSVQD